MIKARKAFYFTCLILSFSCPLFAQSLFLESWKIKDLLEHDTQVRIDSLDLREWAVVFDDGPELDLNSSDYLMEKIGRYSFVRKSMPISGPTKRTLSITYYGKRDTVRKTFKAEGRVDVFNLPGSVTWTIFGNKNSIPYEGALEVKVIPDTSNVESGSRLIARTDVMEELVAVDDNLLIDKPGRYVIGNIDTISAYLIDSDTFKVNLAPKEQLVIEKNKEQVEWLTRSDFQTGKIDKPEFYELMSYLTVHSSYREQEFNYYTFLDVYEKYKENPFLYDLLYPKLYAFDLDAVAPYMEFDEVRYKALTSRILAKDYGWIKRLYDKEALNFREQVLNKKDVDYFQQLDLQKKVAVRKLVASSEIAQAEYAKVKTFDANIILAGLSDFIVDRAQKN